MPGVRSVLKPSVRVFYVVFVLEIRFMISPAALYFYGVYGRVLKLFHRLAATAWLTQFFLSTSQGSAACWLRSCHTSRDEQTP